MTTAAILNNAGNPDVIARTIAQSYNRSRRCIALHAEGAVIEKTYLLECMEFCWNVDKALSFCSTRTKMIIRNAYLEPEEEKEWYTRYWKRSTYSRCRRKALQEFFDMLGELLDIQKAH